MGKRGRKCCVLASSEGRGDSMKGGDGDPGRPSLDQSDAALDKGSSEESLMQGKGV